MGCSLYITHPPSLHQSWNPRIQVLPVSKLPRDQRTLPLLEQSGQYRSFIYLFRISASCTSLSPWSCSPSHHHCLQGRSCSNFLF